MPQSSPKHNNMIPYILSVIITALQSYQSLYASDLSDKTGTDVYQHCRTYFQRLFLDTVQYNTIRYNTIRYNTIQYNTIQYHTIQYNTIQYHTIQYNTIQYNTIQYNTIKCSTIQHRDCYIFIFFQFHSTLSSYFVLSSLFFSILCRYCAQERNLTL
jgi:hypothetical protein